MRFLPVLLVLAACATGTIRPAPRATDPNTKLITRVVEFITPQGWRESGYSRTNETEIPFKLAIAGDGTACPVMTLDVDPIRVGYYYICRSEWRMRRPT